VISPTEPRWRWRRTGDPVVPKQSGELTAGELREAGAAVMAFQDVRSDRCPVCGGYTRLWRATMELPPPASDPLPLGRGCTPDHAVAEAPTSWAGVAAGGAAPPSAARHATI
jgi:hypothetical protein